MNAKRFFLILLLFFLITSSLTLTVYAHPGRTDSNGGHYNRSTGEYHYHHGYPAHDHYDIDGDGTIDCPYAFEDKTRHSSSASSGIIRQTPTTVPSVDEYTQKVIANADDTPQRQESSFSVPLVLVCIAFAIYGLFQFLSAVYRHVTSGSKENLDASWHRGSGSKPAASRESRPILDPTYRDELYSSKPDGYGVLIVVVMVIVIIFALLLLIAYLLM